jgi:hypothetical protein
VPAALDDGVEDGSALAGVGGSNEQPVLFAKGCGADGVFHQVVVDLDASIAAEAFECGPLIQGVSDGLLRCRRRFCTHEANVGYFTPTNAANFATAIPLRLNSSSTSSRRARSVQTRPATSTFKT